MERAEKIIEREREKIKVKIDEMRDQADEAYRDWAAFGYARYRKKQERLEDDANILEDFIYPHNNNARFLAQIRDLKNKIEMLDTFLIQVESLLNNEMKIDYPDAQETAILENIISDWKLRRV